ncbi:MAG: MASE1 domain-containing protein, partial [Rhodocyclaceae bacterium]|nr:MASE1 domain-containing protein [Rhodocyclaceae bacterium]
MFANAAVRCARDVTFDKVRCRGADIKLRPRRPRIMSKVLRRNALIAFAYVLSGYLALRVLAIAPGYVAPLFPPAGIAVAALLIGGWRLLPGIWVGSLCINIIAGFETGLE